MKNQIILSFIGLIWFSSTITTHGNVVVWPDSYILNNELSDSVPEKVNLRIFKINPFQILFNEIPVSFEYSQYGKYSTQIQIGYIFSLSQKSFQEQIFEMGGKENEADERLYRISPYNNHGLSFKLEFRGYGRFLYYAPQFMFKYIYYEDMTFTKHQGGTTVWQTESKWSNIFGVGFMIGHQTYINHVVLDWYAGLGIRSRAMSVRIKKLEFYSSPRYITYPNTKEVHNSVYPFINIGFRVGIKL